MFELVFPHYWEKKIKKAVKKAKKKKETWDLVSPMKWEC